MIGVSVFAAMTVLLAGYAGALYKALLRARLRLARAWSSLEFAWDRRDGEIARLLELCEQDNPPACEANERTERARSALHAARSQHDIAAVNEAEGALRSALLELYPIAARHPQLQADTLLRALRFRMRAHERAIAAYREGYNDAAKALNARIELLPDSLIAGLCHFAPTPLLEFSATPTADIDLGLAFSK